MVRKERKERKKRRKETDNQHTSRNQFVGGVNISGGREDWTATSRGGDEEKEERGMDRTTQNTRSQANNSQPGQRNGWRSEFWVRVN